MKRFLTSLLLSIFATSACCFVDPLTRAQNSIKGDKFEQAVKILENEYKAHPNSVPIKTLLAQTYSDYVLVLCQDSKKPPKIKYPMAKEQFAMALALNPNLQDAKNMYEMIEKIQAQLKNVN